MYSIYADDILIYAPADETRSVYDIDLEMEDNTAGTLSFSIVDTHPEFDRLHRMKTVIMVKRNDKILFKGRVTDDSTDIYNIKKVKCEGKMACFNDSFFPEFDFSGTPEELFHRIIENHNSQVTDKQRFQIGRITVTDKNNYIVRSSNMAARTWKTLKEKCFQSTLGGHLQVRYETDGDYIDWLADYEKVSVQNIEFGKNIIELLIDNSATDVFTAIRPQGAEVDGKRITIESVNGGKDFLVNEERASEYGIIFADPEEAIWDDVTLPENLMKKAEKRLSTGILLKKSIDVKAIDLNLTDRQIEALDVCTYTMVVSQLHNISERYLISKVSLLIDRPENTRFTLGAVKATLTDSSKIQQQTIVKTIGDTIPKTVGQLENDRQYVNEEKVIEIVENSSAFNPIIQVQEQTETIYTLLIESAAGTVVTPNLKGPAGPEGEPGTDGSPGEPGQDGTPGKSAYETAVECGFTGTEAEWIDSLKGDPGEDGSPGSNGEPGTDGKSATIEIGTVTTGEPGTQASVTNSGTKNAAVFNFVIPRGEKGAAGSGSSGEASGGSSTMYAFEIRADGHLWLVSDSETVPENFSIDDTGHLIYTL